MSKVIYLVGSLRNPNIPIVAEDLRELGFEVFDDWFAAGPSADDCWRDYEQSRNHSYQEALNGYAGKHVFNFDTFHLNRSHAGVLVYPAGKSGHLELGHLVSQNKPGFILMDEIPERYDVMKQFASGGIFSSLEELKKALTEYPWPKIANLQQKLHAHDVIWLAGLLEGEGSFTIGKNKTPRLVLQMTDADIVEKAGKLFESSVWNSKRLTKGNKSVYACGVAGITAIEWMRILKPYLGQRRQKQIIDVVSKWLERKSYNKEDNNFWKGVFGL